MSCADYRKAEHGSDWTQGVTGKTTMDHQSACNAGHMHDCCKQHPQANAASADRMIK